MFVRLLVVSFAVLGGLAARQFGLWSATGVCASLASCINVDRSFSLFGVLVCGWSRLVYIVGVSKVVWFVVCH